MVTLRSSRSTLGRTWGFGLSGDAVPSTSCTCILIASSPSPAGPSPWFFLVRPPVLRRVMRAVVGGRWGGTPSWASRVGAVSWVCGVGMGEGRSVLGVGRGMYPLVGCVVASPCSGVPLLCNPCVSGPSWSGLPGWSRCAGLASCRRSCGRQTRAPSTSFTLAKKRVALDARGGMGGLYKSKALRASSSSGLKGPLAWTKATCASW